MINMNKIRFLILAFLLSVLLFTCETSMGMGPSVDLEPPTLKITGIVLPDGTEIPLLEDDNKLFVGPGILVGPGFYLKGTAWDNEKVVEITVEETGSGAEIVDGKPRIWTNANIRAVRPVSDGLGGEYEWSIALDGISPGERNILVTAYDFPRNIGPNSVKQLTLLVDLDPPFIDKINIERQAGITVGLLPKTRLEEMDPSLFEEIDYFQNENFTIRASISHNFSLSGVTLNFIGEDGNNLFQNGLERMSGTTVYAPSWYITAEQLIAANPIYSSGRHYLKVVISARAEAGHSGQNEDKTNLLYNLCWYPEADIPKMQMTVTAESNNVYRFEKGNKLPVRVFDDDNVGEVYASLVALSVWNSYMPSYTDDEKLQSIGNNLNNPLFPELNINRISIPARSTVIEVDAGETRGDYRLIVFAKDKKESGKTGVIGQKFFIIKIVEEGIPVITVDSPTSNTTPVLQNGKNFTITGNVQNLDDLDKIKIAWIPVGAAADNAGWDANKKGQEAILSGNTGVTGNSIKIWELILSEGVNITDKYKKQEFSLTVDIFSDFLYNGIPENESKLFILYVKGKGGDDVFENFSVLPYSKPPVLDITPISYHEVAPNSLINFKITAESPAGVLIEDDAVTLFSKSDNSYIQPLTRNGNVWTGTVNGKSVKANYDYEITAKDKLGFITQQTITIVVTAAPELLRITSPHNSGVVFSSRDTITIQAVFDNPVTTVTGVPRLRLGGFDPSSTVRYATYSGGMNTTTLNFTYDIQNNDYTGTPGASNGLTVTAFDLNGGTISAITPNISTLGASNNLPVTKRLNVDGRAPKITEIAINGKASSEQYYPWHREGEDLTFRVVVDREIRVLGTPKLRLQFDGSATRDADFQTTEDSNKTMVFLYKVKAGDEAVPVKIVTSGSGCFTTADSQMITDTAGSNGNYLSLANIPSSTGTVNVDAVAPAALSLSYTVNNPSSKTIQIGTGNIEANATVEYTINNGANWTTITNPYRIGPLTAVNNYSVRARQTDQAGNVSPDGTKLDFTISDCSLISVSCDNPNGVYKIGDKLTFKLIFSGNVFGSASITIEGGTTANSGTNVTIMTTALTSTNAASILSAEWTIPEGKNWNPVTITGININNVTAVASNQSPGFQDSVRTDYNSSRTGLRVLSIRPTITQINSAAPAGSNTTTVLTANNTVTLTFSHPVWPEQGIITVKPADGWHIPPVLSNDDYYKVSSAVTGTNLTDLSSNYIKTTHGLVKSGGSFTGTPDTTTKYVLNFNLNISDTTGTTNNVRTALNAAKYLWQEIESVSASQVTGAGGSTITLKLDTLPNGRMWKIEIGAGAFRDEAGNTFAGWASSTDYRFWSAKTADPVIRVNRISNNRATSTQDASAPLRTNVEYRIDCETPGATISYNTWNRGNPGTPSTNAQARGVGSYGVATVTNSMPVVAISGKTAPYIYRSYYDNTDGQHNSNIADATALELSSMMDAMGVAGTGTSVLTFSTVQTIGDNSYYTARKDYIAAIARRTTTAPTLDWSDRSYEGAFKTVLVFRNPTTKHSTNGTNTGYMNGIAYPNPLYVKVEGTNLQNGAVTVSGFPLNVNDISGNSSKYLYQVTAGDNNSDRVWISWEVVCDFWQVYMVLSSPVLGTRLNTDTEQWNGRNSWQYWPEMWYRWMYRKYGNWGLLDGHMSAYNEDYQLWNDINSYPWSPTAP